MVNLKEISDSELDLATNLILAEKSRLLREYPGYWTLTRELDVVPKKCMFAPAGVQFDIFGWDTRVHTNNAWAIRRGLQLCRQYLGSSVFAETFRKWEAAYIERNSR
jgi:hypothetical protein